MDSLYEIAKDIHAIRVALDEFLGRLNKTLAWMPSVGAVAAKQAVTATEAVANDTPTAEAEATKQHILNCLATGTLDDDSFFKLNRAAWQKAYKMSTEKLYEALVRVDPPASWFVEALK